jgi:hypothetical protein
MAGNCVLSAPVKKCPARNLLQMAEFSKPGEPDQPLPKISQKNLVKMIGIPSLCSRFIHPP